MHRAKLKPFFKPIGRIPMNHDRSKPASVARSRGIRREGALQGSTMRVGPRLLLYVLDTEVPQDRHTRRVKASGHRGM